MSMQVWGNIREWTDLQNSVQLHVKATDALGKASFLVWMTVLTFDSHDGVCVCVCCLLSAV